MVGEVFLGAETARVPLPAEGVTGEVAIEEVVVHPAGGFAPVGLGDIAGEAGGPHAGVVVHVSRGLEIGDGFIDHVDPSGAVGYRDGEFGGGDGFLRGAEVGEDLVALGLPDALEVFAPAEFLKELFGLVVGVAGEDAVTDEAGADDAVGQKGAEVGDSAAEIVPRARVGRGIDGVDAIEDGFVIDEKVGIIHSGARVWA